MISSDRKRNLSPSEIGERIGHRGAGGGGLWRAYGKRMVTRWCTHGVGDSKCPHEVVGSGYKARLLLNVDEVLEWRRSVGGMGELKPEGEGETIESGGPLIAAGIEESEKRKAESEKRRTEEAAAARAIVNELVTGDPLAALKRLLIELKLKIDASDRDTTSQTFQQLSGAATNIGREIRMAEELRRERDEFSGRLIDRAVAARLIGELAAAVRMQFTAQGAVIGARVLAEVSGVEGEEARQRIAAIAAQAVIDSVLFSLAESAERAAGELEGGSHAEGEKRVSRGGAGDAEGEEANRKSEISKRESQPTMLFAPGRML